MVLILVNNINPSWARLLYSASFIYTTTLVLVLCFCHLEPITFILLHYQTSNRSILSHRMYFKFYFIFSLQLSKMKVFSLVLILKWSTMKSLLLQPSNRRALLFLLFPVTVSSPLSYAWSMEWQTVYDDRSLTGFMAIWNVTSSTGMNLWGPTAFMRFRIHNNPHNLFHIFSVSQYNIPSPRPGVLWSPLRQVDKEEKDGGNSSCRKAYLSQTVCKERYSYLQSGQNISKKRELASTFI